MLRKNVNRGGGEGGGSYSSDITVPNVTVSNYLRTVYTVLGRWGCYSSGITVPNVTVSNPHATPYIFTMYTVWGRSKTKKPVPCCCLKKGQHQKGLMDWLVFNANVSNISAMWWREQIPSNKSLRNIFLQPPYNWNIAESGVKHHNTNPQNRKMIIGIII